MRFARKSEAMAFSRNIAVVPNPAAVIPDRKLRRVVIACISRRRGAACFEELIANECYRYLPLRHEPLVKFLRHKCRACPRLAGLAKLVDCVLAEIVGDRLRGPLRIAINRASRRVERSFCGGIGGGAKAS